MTPTQAAIFGYAILSRVAYVSFVGWSLRRETQAVDFPVFRRRAAFVMNHDAVAFILLCVATRNTWTPPLRSAVSFTAGAVLAVVGLGIKLWAARTLGAKAYYWYNFFDPDDAGGPVTSGPYRFVNNPMYTVGYLQTYGLALICRSWPALIAAAFSHLAILAFYLFIEKPHFQRLHRLS
ncbi:MAG: PEMT/PEM2 methyltransferase family protein [Gemmatimonadales bacterium]